MNPELKDLLSLAQRGLANVGVYISLSLALLGYSLVGQVDWGFGLALAIGQIGGGLIGVRLNNLKNNIEPIVRLLLLVLILASVAKFWKLY